jgi:hypothetical protein
MWSANTHSDADTTASLAWTLEELLSRDESRFDTILPTPQQYSPPPWKLYFSAIGKLRPALRQLSTFVADLID